MGNLSERFLRPFGVDVAEGNDLVPQLGKSFEIVTTATANADECQSQLFAGRSLSTLGDRMPRHDGRHHSSGSSTAQKTTTVDS